MFEVEAKIQIDGLERAEICRLPTSVIRGLRLRSGHERSQVQRLTRHLQVGTQLLGSQIRPMADVNGDGHFDAAGFGLDGIYIALAK